MAQLNRRQLRPASLSSRLTAAHGMVSRESRERGALTLIETNVSSLFNYDDMRNITHHIRGRGSNDGKSMNSFSYSYVPFTIADTPLLDSFPDGFGKICKKYNEENHWKGSDKMNNLKIRIKKSKKKGRENGMD